VTRVFGRALDADGKLVADTASQEHYVEDRFNVPVAMQQALAKQLARAGADRFALADDLARLLVEHAFLGQLDVNPVNPPGGGRGGKGAANQCEFWAQAAESNGNGPVRLRIGANPPRRELRATDPRRRKGGRRPALAARGEARLEGSSK